MVVEGSEAVVVMLGLPGVRVLGVVEVAGEVHVSEETTAVRVGCHVCGVIATPHGRREVVARDVPVAGRPVRLRWRKRVWRCDELACQQRTWTETHPAVRPRAALTVRAEKEIARRVGELAQPVARLAVEFAVSWATAMACVRRHGQPLIDDPTRLAGVAALGMDETAFLRASALRHTSYVLGLVDAATGRLLDVVEDRTAKAVAGGWPRKAATGSPRSVSSRWIRIGGTRTRSGCTWATPRWWSTTGMRSVSGPVLRLGRQLRRLRDPPAGAHDPPLGERGPRLAHHRRRQQRPHRSGQPAHQEGQTNRARVPELRQLPATTAAALRRRLAHSPSREHPTPPSTLICVEPLSLAWIHVCHEHRKVGRCRGSSITGVCVTVREMGVWPSGVALQGEASNHRKLRRSRAGVVSVAEKVRHDRIRCEPRRRT